jgi:hypothetical protein
MQSPRRNPLTVAVMVVAPLLALAAPSGTPGTARAQVAPAWVAQYPGLQASAVVADGTGNSYVAGTTLPDAAHNFNHDIVVVKYDLAGNRVWAREFDETDDATNGDDAANSIVLDAAGNVLVGGHSFLNGAPLTKTILLKYDPNGTLLWKTKASGTGAKRLATDAAGNVYAIAQTAGTSSADFVTLKVSPSGAVLWERRYNGPSTFRDVPSGLAVTAAGEVAVTGESAGGVTAYDVATIRYGTDGAVRWVRRFNNPAANGNGSGADVAFGPNGEVYAGGYTATAATGDTDFLLVKYDAGGSRVWVRTYNGPPDKGDAIKRVRVDSRGNVIVTGYEQQANFYSDFATAKYDPNGNRVWVRRLNLAAGGDEIPYFLLLGTDDAVYVTGESAGRVATVKYDTGGTEQWSATYDHGGTLLDRGYGLALDAGNGVVVAAQSPLLTLRYAQPPSPIR